MKNDSITETNTKITVLSDIIQNARITLLADNSGISLSSDVTRKIVLFCLLLLRTNEGLSNINTLRLNEVLTLVNIPNSKYLGLDLQDYKNIELKNTIDVIKPITKYYNWEKLLNYALEALEYDVSNYFSVVVSHGARRKNAAKKRRGIYYTPLDVVDFMVSQCLESVLPRNNLPTILDCSCGSGIFLIQSFRFLEEVINPQRRFEISKNLLAECIWGIDISPAAIDCCKTVFIKYYKEMYSCNTKQLHEVLQLLAKSLIIGDATQLHEIFKLHIELPKTFDCIIGNPPYVSKGKNSNLFIPFVENLVNFSSRRSCSSLVLPLSICYSQGKEYASIRELISNDIGTWTFLNYDRSPDSLFGDQVKTRNTILFRLTNSIETCIYTTKLKRWTSEKRNQLFKSNEFCDISDLNITKYVPKISSLLEKQVFNSISCGSKSLKDLFIPRKSEYGLIVNGTAYNWLCVYDHLPPSTDEKGNSYLSKTTKVYYLSNETQRYFCIALLSNRIAYWYWVVIGDGFHLSSSFLSDYSIGWEDFSSQQQDELCRLGKLYSERTKETLTISFNAGKRIVNYSHWEAMDIVQRIESIIIEALKLPDSFASYIKNWYHNQVYCDRKANEKR